MSKCSLCRIGKFAQQTKHEDEAVLLDTADDAGGGGRCHGWVFYKVKS